LGIGYLELDIKFMRYSIITTSAVWLITIYQKTLSPDHGWFRGRYPYGFCRFYPTCSEYAKQAIIAHGFWRGAWLGAKRIIRCNPFTHPAIDQVPNQ